MAKDQGKDIALLGPAWLGDIFGLGNGIGVRKEDQDLKEILNRGIKQIAEDGTLKSWP